MTDNTQPDAREFTMSQYASKDCMIGAMRERIADLEAQLEAIGAGGVNGPLMGKPQAMPDLSALTERGAKAWAGVDAQGLRDGVASVAASAGSEPVAGMNEYGVRGYLAATLKCWHRLTGDEAAELVAMTQRLAGLYTNSSPPDCPGHNYDGTPRSAALVEAQQPTTHVQNPAEIEHVAGDVSKNGVESDMAQQPAPSAAAAVENLRKALQFYADKDHFSITGHGAWDTVSGEPQNYWCDEEGTATVEDGTIARLALAGHQIKFDADAAPQPSPTPQADSQPAPVRADASNESMNLAVMVLSDCGHSSNYKPLLERVAGRIDRHVERLLTAQQADIAMRAQAAPAAVAGPSETPKDWRDQFTNAVYADLAAADNQDVPLEEYPARILKVLDSIVGPRHPTVIHWRNDAIQACIAIAYKYCRDPESFQYLKQDLQALIFAARAPADSVQEDAARYRWLIDQHWIQTEVDWRLISTDQDSTIKQLDAAIDAAIDASRKQGANHD